MTVLDSELSAWEKYAAPGLTRSAWDIDWPVRARTKFTNESVETLADVLKYSRVDLLRSPNFGTRTLIEVERLLEACGLRLR